MESLLTRFIKLKVPKKAKEAIRNQKSSEAQARWNQRSSPWLPGTLMLCILLTSPASAQLVENFDDGNAGDGVPFAWFQTGPTASSQLMDDAYRIAGDVRSCCPGITADVDPYEDIRIETTLQYLGGGYAGIHFRQQGNQNYWTGVQDDGQLFIGHNVGGTQFLRNRVYLPTGRINDGDTIAMELEVIGSEISLTAWDTDAGIDSAATVSYNDTQNVRPDGSRFGIHFNPNRPDSDRVVDVLSFTYTQLDFDCNSSGMLEVEDLNCTVATDLDNFLDHTGLYQGDANGDGMVAFDDFLTLSANFGTDGNYVEGDFDLGGTVDFSDFLILSANFGLSQSTAASVPEPSGMIPFGFGCLALALRRTGISRR